MKKKSKMKPGFTLLETIISMAITIILLVGVHGAYMLLIRNTKDGEVKQEAAIIGKKVIEEIKSGQRMPENRVIGFDKSGNETNDNPVYRVNLEMDNQNISINDGSRNRRFFVGNNIISDLESDVKNENLIKTENTIVIDVNTQGNGIIKFSDGTNEKDIESIDNINLDFKYLTQDSNMCVKINSEYKNELNLCILNSKCDEEGNSNVKIKVIQGNVKKSYRYENADISKSGVLYKISLSVDGRNSKGVFENNIFSTEIFKNMD